MKTSIETLARSTASDIFDDPVFKNIIEDHLTWLITHPTTISQPVTANLIEIYDFDWIGLLTNLNISPDLHHIVIRMNGGMSLTDIPVTLRTLLVPSYDLIQNFIMLIASTKRIK